MKRIITFIILLGTIQLQAQVFSENALFFAQSSFGGTARFQGLAGATTALGGDISNAANNPAGLGFIRKGQYTITPTLNLNNANATLFGEQTNDNRLNFNINHFGLTITNGKGATQRGTFAITYTKLNDFNSAFTYEATNSNNTIVDFLLNEADLSIPYDDLFNQVDFGIVDIFGLAYNNFLINPDYRDTLPAECGGVCTDTYSSFRFEPIRQSEEVVRRGSHHEWDFAYGGHINNRVYLGVSVGIQSIRFEEQKTYREQTIQGAFEFDNLELIEELDITGTGVNLEIGSIIRITDRIRLGLTATTPTVIRVNDLYQASLSTNYRADSLAVFFEKQINGEWFDFEIVYDDIPRNNFAETEVLEAEYNIVTPYRLKGGLSFFLGKKGFISADAEYVGYRSTRLRALANNEDVENEFIRNTYKNAWNIRIGGEARLADFRVRAGFAYYGHPYENNPDAEANLLLTGGLGYRNKKFFADIAFVGQAQNFQYNPYFIGDGSPNVDVDDTNIRMNITVGSYF
ncbi:MAG: OmpP1/FadL family transporter [Flammeovirgaceae bacterium]